MRSTIFGGEARKEAEDAAYPSDTTLASVKTLEKLIKEVRDMQGVQIPDRGAGIEEIEVGFLPQRHVANEDGSGAKLGGSGVAALGPSGAVGIFSDM